MPYIFSGMKIAVTLAIIGVIASLYPLSTVALARVVDREHLRPVQWAGLVLAVAALVSFSAG